MTPHRQKRDPDAVLRQLQKFRDQFRQGAFEDISFKEIVQLADIENAAKAFAQKVDNCAALALSYSKHMLEMDNSDCRPKRTRTQLELVETEESTPAEGRRSAEIPNERFLDSQLASVQLTFPIHLKMPSGTVVSFTAERFARLIIDLVIRQRCLNIPKEPIKRPVEWPSSWSSPTLNTKHESDYFAPNLYNLSVLQSMCIDVHAFQTEWENDRKAQMFEFGFRNNFLDDAAEFFRQRLQPFVKQSNLTVDSTLVSFQLAQQRVESEFSFLLESSVAHKKKRRTRRKKCGENDVFERNYNRLWNLNEIGILQPVITWSFSHKKCQKDEQFRLVFHGEQNEKVETENKVYGMNMPLYESNLLLQALDGACELDNNVGETFDVKRIHDEICAIGVQSQATNSQFGLSFASTFNSTVNERFSLDNPDLSTTRSDFIQPNYVFPTDETKTNLSAEREINEIISCVLSDDELKEEGWDDKVVAEMRKCQLRDIGVYSGRHVFNEPFESTVQLSPLINYQMFKEPRLTRNPAVWKRTDESLPLSAAYFTDLVMYATIASTKPTIITEEVYSKLIDNQSANLKRRSEANDQVIRKAKQRSQHAQSSQLLRDEPAASTAKEKTGEKRLQTPKTTNFKSFNGNTNNHSDVLPRNIVPILNARFRQREQTGIRDKQNEIHLETYPLESFSDSHLGVLTPEESDDHEECQSDNENEQAVAMNRRVRKYLRKEARMKRLRELRRKMQFDSTDDEEEMDTNEMPENQLTARRLVCKQCTRAYDKRAPAIRPSLSSDPDDNIVHADDLMTQSLLPTACELIEPGSSNEVCNGEHQNANSTAFDGKQLSSHNNYDEMNDNDSDIILLDDIYSYADDLEELVRPHSDDENESIQQPSELELDSERSPSPEYQIYEEDERRMEPKGQSFRRFIDCSTPETTPIKMSEDYTMEHLNFQMNVSVPPQPNFVPLITGLLDPHVHLNDLAINVPQPYDKLRAHSFESKTGVYMFDVKTNEGRGQNEPFRDVVYYEAIEPLSSEANSVLNLRLHDSELKQCYPGIIMDPNIVEQMKERNEEEMRNSLMEDRPSQDKEWTPEMDRMSSRRYSRRSRQSSRATSQLDAEDDQNSLAELASVMYDEQEVNESTRQVVCVRAGLFRHQIAREAHLPVEKVKNALVTVLHNKHLGAESYDLVCKLAEDYCKFMEESQNERIRVKTLLQDPSNLIEKLTRDERIADLQRLENTGRMITMLEQLKKGREEPLRCKQSDAKSLKVYGNHHFTSLLFFAKALISGATVHDLNQITIWPMILDVCSQHQVYIVNKDGELLSDNFSGPNIYFTSKLKPEESVMGPPPVLWNSN
ncbi:hypothetical protein M3Y98_00231100 [Aphelenchoides besseyi]|nr:hypothetical protein M3Y98_00231100 [Aphelenchoides besseyi]